MSKPAAADVILSPHGLVIVGTRGPGTRLWFRPTGKTQLTEFRMPFLPPRESPAALLPDGRLLVVGRNGETMLLQAGRTPQPGPLLQQVVLEGLSPTAVAFGVGPRFFRFVDGAWRDESPTSAPAAEQAHRHVAAVGDGFAVGSDGDCWVGPAWKKAKVKTDANLRCAQELWAAGEGATLQRKGKTFTVTKVNGDVTSIAPWGKGALMVVDGVLRDHTGTLLGKKAPQKVSSVSAIEGCVWCVADGALFESTDARVWRRKSLPR
jgi:hypothetical protein